jgi:hypothetical protein
MAPVGSLKHVVGNLARRNQSECSYAFVANGDIDHSKMVNTFVADALAVQDNLIGSRF